MGHILIENDDFVLGNTYMKMFHEEKSNMKISEKNRIKRKIVNIIKENTIHNIGELNKLVLELLKIDDGFK